MSDHGNDPVEDAVARALYLSSCDIQRDEARGTLHFPDFDRTPELWGYWHRQAQVAMTTYRRESSIGLPCPHHRNFFREWLARRVGL